MMPMDRTAIEAVETEAPLSRCLGSSDVIQLPVAPIRARHAEEPPAVICPAVGAASNLCTAVLVPPPFRALSRLGGPSIARCCDDE